MKFVHLSLLALSLTLFLLVDEVASAQDDVATRLARLINQVRLARGLAPYALNAKLALAAQGHSDDIKRSGTHIGHTGSDGSTPLQRIDRAGYVRAGGWGGEIWAWAQSPEQAYYALWQDDAHLGMIFHPVLREMGIGITSAPRGYIMVVDFGASPNVLPVFINDGANATRARNVTLTLTNEDAIPFGDGSSRMGRAVNIQVSARRDFADAPVQSHSTKISFTLPNAAGAQTVFVKSIDAKGRTAVNSATINLILVMTPTPTATGTRASALTQTPTTRATQTPTTTATPTEIATLSSTMAATPRGTETPMAMTTPSRIPAPTDAPADALSETSSPALSPTSEDSDSFALPEDPGMRIGAFVSFLFVLSMILAWRAKR